MKPSRYNIFTCYKPHNVHIGMNLVSGGLYVFSQDQFLAAQKILADPDNECSKLPPLHAKLTEARFLIDDDLDEISLLKLRNRKLRYNQNNLAMVVAPTLACNFDCPYCYVDREKNVMQPSVLAKVKLFFDKKMEYANTADICITGGEPLLVMDIVENLTKHFTAQAAPTGKNISISIATNGYLLNDAIIEKLKTCGNIRLQITLDGFRDYHDRYRRTLNKEGTYDQILENVIKANNQGLKITIRSNLNKDNVSGCYALLDDLAGKIKQKQDVLFAPCMVRQPHIHANIPACNVFTNQEFSELEPEIIRYANQKGFQTGALALGAAGVFCGANTLSMIVIDSFGSVFKCWCNLGDSAHNKVGFLNDDGDVIYNNLSVLCRWMDWDPFEIDDCIQCPALPLCLGGCMYYNVAGETDKLDIGCSHRKHNIENILINYYLNASENQKNKKEEQTNEGN